MSKITSIALLIPCYNEEKRLLGTIEELSQWLKTQTIKTRVVFIDDGSTDRTREILYTASKNNSLFSVVTIPNNRGKGNAVREGVRTVIEDAMVFCDADLAYPLSNIDEAIRKLNQGADIVIGSRDLAENPFRGLFIRRLTHKLFSFVVGCLIPVGVSDTQCGFKAFRTPVAKALFSFLTVERFAFDVEILYLAKLWRLNIVRIPVVPRDRRVSSVNVIKDGILMLYDLFRIRNQSKKGLYPSQCPIKQ